jgi:pimeloyl-ACP methyl ester carboxylesterase
MEGCVLGKQVADVRVDAEEIADGIPGARLVKVPECGHFSTLERPDTVTKELIAFLRD